MRTMVDTGTISAVQNVYIDALGHLRPRKFPTSGLWTYDGQFFLPPKNKQSKVKS